MPFLMNKILMKPMWLGQIIGKFVFLMILLNTPLHAASKETLSLMPSHCVALTQGQKCYVDATLHWQSPTVGNYCIYSTQQEKPLSCWQQQSQGQYSAEFVTNKNIVFTLRMANSKASKASQLLKVTWVHQKRGQPRLWWRIF